MEVAELNGRQIRTLDSLVLVIIIHTLQRLIINHNLQRNKQVPIKLQQRHILHRTQPQTLRPNILQRKLISLMIGKDIVSSILKP